MTESLPLGRHEFHADQGRRRVTVVGAGNVGSTCAQELARRDYADVVLVDIKEGLPQGKALDINQMGAVLGYEPNVTGSNAYEATAGSGSGGGGGVTADPIGWLEIGPGGATFREAHLIMELLHDSGVVGSVDIVELNPFLDERGRTARTAVELIGSLFGQQIADRPTPSNAIAPGE